MQREVQRFVGSRLADFDEGNFQHICTQAAQIDGKGTGLMMSADAFKKTGITADALLPKELVP